MAEKKQPQERILERDEETDFWRQWGQLDTLSTPVGKFCKAQIELVLWDIGAYYEKKKTSKKSYFLSAVDFINRQDDDWGSWNWTCEAISLSPCATREALYKKFEIDKLMQSSGMLF